MALEDTDVGKEAGRRWVWVHSFKETLCELAEGLKAKFTSKQTFAA